MGSAVGCLEASRVKRFAFLLAKKPAERNCETVRITFGNGSIEKGVVSIATDRERSLKI